MTHTDRELTDLLDAWSAGDPEAFEELMPLVVEDLRRMARAYLAREVPGHTLQPTALVNELYLRLANRRTVQWESRRQFFATMAELMRRILVDHARHRKALRSGGQATHTSFEETFTIPASLWGERQRDGDDFDLLALDNALSKLAEVDSRQCRIVELRYFGGLTIEETASALDLGTATVKREWRTARLWLLRALAQSGSG